MKDSFRHQKIKKGDKKHDSIPKRGVFFVWYRAVQISNYGTGQNRKNITFVIKSLIVDFENMKHIRKGEDTTENGIVLLLLLVTCDSTNHSGLPFTLWNNLDDFKRQILDLHLTLIYGINWEQNIEMKTNVISKFIKLFL